MVRLAFAGVLLLVSSVLTAADPKPRPDGDGRPLPAEAIRRFGLSAKEGDKVVALPSARWPAYRFSADGKTVTRVGGDTAVTWDGATGRELGRVAPAKLLAEGAPGVPLIADNYPKKLAARSPDGKAALTYTNPTVQQSQYKLTLTVGGKAWPDAGLKQLMVGVLQLAFTPDGRYALAQLDQEHLHIWDVTGDESSGNAITFATPGPSGFRQVPLMHPAPDSRRVALVEFDPKTPTLHKDAMAGYQWRLGVYELDTRRRVSGLSGAGVLTAVDWSADATRIGGAGRRAGAEYGSEAGFAFVATDAGAFVMPPTEFSRPATACALSPDARTLAVGTDSEVHLYEARTGFLRHAFKPAGGDVLALRFHPDGRSLLSESADGAVTQWDVRGDLTPLPEPDAAALDRLWADLDATDAAKAFQAVRRIATHPKKSLPFLKGKVAGEKRPTDAEIDGRVADLKSRAFAERNAAEKQLRAMGMIAHPALKVALATDSSPELRERATRLLAVTFTPATVRTTRLVEAVELAGTAEAKSLLTAWAGNAGPELTAEAMATLRRGRK